jgi:hypothetical protein
MRGPPRFLPALVAAAATITALCAPGVLALAQSRPLTAVAAAQAVPPAFLETFDGSPAAPVTFVPQDERWLNAEYSSVLDPYKAAAADLGHGPDCAGPPATHVLQGDPRAGVFRCRDHLMTGGTESMRLALVPAVTSSLANGATATLTFDVSTLGSSDRDWLEIWAVPYGDDYPITGDGERPPLRGLKLVSHLPTAAGATDSGWWGLTAHRNGQESAYWTAPCCGPKITNSLVPSASTRTKFELKVSRTHVSFRAPEYGLTWVDTDLPAGVVDWDTTMFYLHHSAYTPSKGGECPASRTDCGHNTWHWDNLQVAPATPLSVRFAQQRLADATSPELRFNRPGAPGSLFRGWVNGGVSGLQHSFDGGASWQTTPYYRPSDHPENMQALKFPVPDGTTRIAFRREGGGAFVVGNANLVSQATGAAPPATAVPLATTAPVATATRTAVPPTTVPPTATRTPAAATATRTAIAATATRTAVAPTATRTAVAPTATSAAATATRPAGPSATPAPRTFTISGSASPGTVAPGGAAALSVQVTSAAAGPALIDFEVYGPDGQRVYQTVNDGQAFSAGQSRTFTASWTVPAGTPPGTYTLKTGIFSAGWGQLYTWNNQVAQFRVQ